MDEHRNKQFSGTSKLQGLGFRVLVPAAPECALAQPCSTPLLADAAARLQLPPVLLQSAAAPAHMQVLGEAINSLMLCAVGVNLFFCSNLLHFLSIYRTGLFVLTLIALLHC